MREWHSRIQRLWDDDSPDTSGPKIRWRRNLVAAAGGAEGDTDA